MRIPTHTEIEQLDIAIALHRLCVQKKLPPIWIDGGKVAIRTHEWSEPRPISWSQAERLAYGAPLERVLSPAKVPRSQISRKPARVDVLARVLRPVGGRRFVKTAVPGQRASACGGAD